jgi:coenzyme F420 hydrogenase subunit beta
MNQFLAKQSIQLSEVSALRYRGHGCPGPTRIETRDGRVIEKTYLDLWGDDESAWHLPYRCKICPDGIGESADIAAADTWPGGSPTPAMLEDDPGTNAVLARTVTGARLLADAEADGHLVIEREATVDELTDWQPHQVAKKKAAWARLAGRRRAGALTLESSGLRLRELARAQPVGALLDQGRGSIVRVRDGRADEDVPVAADG